ncbi:MAG: hypothetical protein COV73_01005, partial [Candidatus Omnitrophica bacterium CG11_big_fil_rev_8_21_14_0_20_43_6]
HDALPGSAQLTSTGVGHFQGLSLDIKQAVGGEGIQFNVRYDAEGKIQEVLAQHLTVGTWTLALPGYVDYVVNLGGLRFNDFSVGLNDEDARAISPAFDFSQAGAVAGAISEKVKCAPYSSAKVDSELYLINNLSDTPQPRWIEGPSELSKKNLVKVYRDLTPDALKQLLNVIIENSDKIATEVKAPQRAINQVSLGKGKINIVIFRGGRGAGPYVGLLKKLPFVNVNIVLGATDDGRSWFFASQDFDATGIPDCGKSLLDLASDKQVEKFLSLRMKRETADEAAEQKERDDLRVQFYLLLSKLNGHPEVILDSDVERLYKKFIAIQDEGKKEELLLYINKFYNIFSKYHPKSKFTFNDIPMRSLVLLGAAWQIGTRQSPAWQGAADAVGRLLDLREGDRVIFATEERQHLIAMLEDGTIYFAETGINEHPKTSDFIGLWLVDREDIWNIQQSFRGAGIELMDVDSDDREVKYTTRKVRDVERVLDAAGIIAQHSRSANVSIKGKVPANPLAKEAIKNADVIVYSVTSLESNMGSALIVDGIGEVVAENSAAAKIYLVNPTVENDPVINEKNPTALDMLNRLFR